MFYFITLACHKCPFPLYFVMETGKEKKNYREPAYEFTDGRRDLRRRYCRNPGIRTWDLKFGICTEGGAE